MKNILLSVLCVAASVYGHAQETAVNAAPGDVVGYGSIRNGESYYIAYMQGSEKKDSSALMLNLYDRNLQPVKQATIEVPASARIGGLTSNGDFTMLVMADPVRQTRTTMILDREGHVMHSNEETSIKPAVLGPEYAPSIYTIEPNQFVMVRLAGAKKNGYEVEAIDQELNTRWIKTFVPDNGSLSVVDARVFLDRLFILRREKKEKTIYSVQCINISTSKEIYTTELRQGAELCTPAFIKMSDASLLTAGTYTQEGKSDQQEGVFFARLDPEGKANIVLDPWEITKRQIKNDAIASLANGKTKVFIEDILENRTNPGEYTLVGEEVNQSADQSKNVVFTVSDMLLFHLSREGLITGVDVIEKKKTEAVVKNVPAEKTGSVAEWLYKKQFFPYSGIIESGPRQILIYKNDDGGITKAYFRTVDSIGSVTSLDINRKMPGDKQAAANTYVFDMASDAPQPFRGAGVGNQGQVMLYDMGPSIFRMNLQPVPERNEGRPEGNDNRNERR